MKWTTDEFTGRRFGKYEVLCRLAIGGMADRVLNLGGGRIQRVEKNAHKLNPSELSW